MSTVIRISDQLAKEAKTKSKVEHRSMTSQLEYWATIGKAAEDNPDLPFSGSSAIIVGFYEGVGQARSDVPRLHMCVNLRKGLQQSGNGLVVFFCRIGNDMKLVPTGCQ
ncbi:MAG: hypothetical protein EA353_00230 [Puniceicoccaceae bacterium]|nr:MAG: hypothetical protein EA353_00230 [Puniceicoccaceae bacterium]